MARLWISLAFAALLALAWSQFALLEPLQESGMLPVSPPTPYVRYSLAAAGRPQVLVVHGLNSNKEFMQIFSMGLADVGFDVFSIDLPGHGDSPIGFEASLAQTAVKNTLDHLGNVPIVVGHSLGAGLLLDLAVERPFDTVILLSPPPTPLDSVNARRVLVLVGQWDIPPINVFVPVLADIGDSRIEARTLPWGFHSSAVMSPDGIRGVVEWLGGNTAQLKTRQRVAWLVMMFAAGFGLGFALLPGKPIQGREIRVSRVLVQYVLAGCGAVLLLKFVVPMSWVRIFAMDYVVSFLLVAGIIVNLCGGLKPPAYMPSRSIFIAIIAATYTIGIIGLLIGSNIFHIALTDGRWWRFPAIAIAGFPLFMADEVFLRPITPRWKALGVGILTRILFGALILTGVLVLNPADAFLALVLHVVVSFWLALWLVTEAIHRNTQDPLAAAIFASLVQGWAFAAVFVIT